MEPVSEACASLSSSHTAARGRSFLGGGDNQGSQPRLCSASRNKQHSRLFRPPFGRRHSSSSQTVCASSVRLRVENSRVICRITSSSSGFNSRPQNVRPPPMVTGMMRHLLVAGPHAHLTELRRECPEKSLPVLAQLRSLTDGQSPAKGFALDIPAGYGSQGVRSQKPECAVGD